MATYSYPMVATRLGIGAATCEHTIKQYKLLRMTNKHAPVLGTLLILLLLFGVACASNSTQTETLAPLDIQITATDIAYDVNEITAVPGQPIRISLINDGALIHDYSITAISLDGEPVAANGGSDDSGMDAHAHGDEDESTGVDSDVHVAAAPGSTGTLEFTPTESGIYEYVCTVEGHKEAGMVGTLVIE